MDENPDQVTQSQRRRKIVTDDDRILCLTDEIGRRARRMYDARVAKSGLNQTQWRIIRQLLRDLALTQAEITKILGLESATIGQAVTGLCARGLMERLRAEKERRAWQLTLTEQLDNLLPELRGSAERLYDVLWRDIAPDEKRTLQQILAQISANRHRTETE